MNKINILIIVSAFNLLCNPVLSQINSAPYKIATWAGFREAAISYTFDDNCPNQLAVAIPLFNEFDYRVTMFIPSSWITVWTGLQTAADKGHEIASHTVTHTNLGGMNPSQQVSEFRNSRETVLTLTLKDIHASQ